MTSADSAGHVFIVGFMGAGKSTVGRILGERLDRPVVDIDAKIEHAAGTSIAQIFAEKGEGTFRALESDALFGLADKEPSVVACGGGIVLSDDNRRFLKQHGSVVYLEVSAGEALARIGNASGRPLLAGSGGPSAAATLFDARVGLYRAVADITVDTDACEPAELADQIAAALEQQGLLA